MIDEILLQVEKPARYIGNEVNMVVKNPKDVDIRFAFCFPDVYEVGMSHLGLQILYYFLNRREDTYCERCFTPWVDMEQKMRENNIPLFCLESGDELKKFDFVGFTLQYEMSYTNVLNMLDLANIPIWSKDRTEDDPIIIAGGPCAYNPEPLADIIDVFYIGEGEVSYDKFFDVYKEHKKNGGTKEEFLEKILEIPGMYVPKFYDVSYNEDGTVKEIKPNNPKAPKTIKKVIVDDMNAVFYPEKQMVPLIETVHDRVTLEVFRGCIRGCRFCQAGYVYRPVRERGKDKVLSLADSLVRTSGHEEIGLTSLSTGDYTEFVPLADELLDRYSKDKISISLPSLRIDAFSLDLMDRVQAVRKSGLTFAPEAGTQRLRDVINKGITEEEILNIVDGFDYQSILYNGGVWFGADDYNKLVGNADKEYIYKDGEIVEKPAYVPTAEEKALKQINEIMATNDEQIADIKDAMLVAVLTNDTELQEELKQEYAAVIEDTNNKLKEVNVND